MASSRAHEPLRTRRDFFRGVVVTAAAAALPRAAQASTEAVRSLAFVNTHTREVLETTYWNGDRYDSDALARINIVLRDHRTEEIKAIDLGLLDLLHALGGELGAAEPYHVISGYRSPATNRGLRSRSEGVAKNSLHMQGQAIDIRVPGVALRRVQRVAAQLRRGGVGYYQASDFVHVDVGRVRYW